MTEKQFARMIKEKRMDRGITQTEAAIEIPMKIPAYRKIENGIMEPSFFVLSRLAIIYDLDMNEILKEEKKTNQIMFFD